MSSTQEYIREQMRIDSKKKEERTEVHLTQQINELHKRVKLLEENMAYYIKRNA
jgi:hypothetical protein